ncbi:MAG TPA: hypothetical protein VGN26_22090 [Armatimonadota bacterium]
MRSILHLIMPGFYAGVEQRIDPELEGRPVIVAGRRWVMDASPEARVKGVCPGMARPHARQIVPDATWVDFAEERYQPFAHQVWDLLVDYTLILQPLHAHEVFADLSGCPDPVAVTSELVERLEMSRRHAVVTVASCKLVAKAVSRMLERRHSFGSAASWVERKTFDVPEEEMEFFRELPLSFLWPLSPQAQERLRHLGLKLVRDLQRVPERDLVRQFGYPEADRLRRYAFGKDSSRVLALYPPPDLVESLTLDEGLSDEGALRFCLDRLTQRISQQLRWRQEGCRRLDLKLRLAGGSELEGSVTLSRAYYDFEELRAALWRAFLKCEAKAAVEELQVRAADLQPLAGHQRDLFQYGCQERRKSLEQVFEVLKERFGQSSLDYGSQRFPAMISRRERVLAQILSSWLH